MKIMCSFIFKQIVIVKVSFTFLTVIAQITKFSLNVRASKKNFKTTRSKQQNIFSKGIRILKKKKT